MSETGNTGSGGATGASTRGAPAGDAESRKDGAIERGTYEVIRDRLVQHGRTLAEKAEALNDERIGLFGGRPLAIAGNVRIRTENNCIPRDILSVGGRLLFGYNVFLGLKTEIRVEDVFSVHALKETDGGYELESMENGQAAFLTDPRFVADYKDLNRYYKDARLLNLRRVGERILAVFQVGDQLSDVKALRWTVDAAGGIDYLDNQGDRDHVFPPSHDFAWTPTTRDDHVAGVHPHVNILDEVFVETVGGDLTVKVEDNTESGQGIYAEHVDERDQSLDDAQIEYARLGTLILIRVKPYREEAWRHLVFNTLTKTVTRIDHIGRACVQLPEDHGIIYPGGYYLQRGETKTYDTDTDGMVYERCIRSPNGEDVLYVFYHRENGRYALLPYNLIRKEVANPIHGNGYCLFEDGTLLVLKRHGTDPTRVHPMQIWSTPFTSDVFAASRAVGDSPLERIGNADLVRGISDCLSIRRLVEDQEPSRRLYEALIGAVQRTLDQYHWLGAPETGDLSSTLKEIRSACELIVDEFEKVQSLRGQAKRSLAAAEEGIRAVFSSLRPDFWKQVDEFVQALSALRRERGKLITLRQVRYVDLARIDELEADVVARFDEVSAKCVEYLLEPEALAPYHAKITALEGRIADVAKVTETRPLDEELTQLSEGLALLTEVVGGLAIDDATIRTRILQGISEVMAQGNRVRALLQARRKELLGKEGVAEFAAQFALYGQSVTSALALAETPEACDEALSQLLLSLEELEGKFSEFDEFLEQLAEKRAEVVEVVGAKKQLLLDRRQRRAQNLTAAADRILSGIGRRAATFGELDDLNAYFASDPMVLKLRDLAAQLRDLDDSVRADELDSRLKSSREDAVRSLRDRRDIFEDGQSVIRLGKHRFSVNTQPLDLTMVPRGDGMSLHLSGTDYYEPIRDGSFLETRRFWSQEIVSETRDVYRGEYLAYSLLTAAEQERDGQSLAGVYEVLVDEGDLLDTVRRFAASRYDEGYERGVHDADAARILVGIGGLYRTAGLLRFAPAPRAAACLFWQGFDDAAARARFVRESASLGRLRTSFRTSPAIRELQDELADAVAAFHEREDLSLDAAAATQAGRYLFEQLAVDPDHFVVSGEAVELADGLLESLGLAGTAHEFEEDLRGLADDLESAWRVTTAWLDAWIGHETARERFRPVLPEAAAMLVCGDRDQRDVSTAIGSVTIDGLLGQHPRIAEQKLTLRLDEFLSRLSAFAGERVPAFRAYLARRHALVAEERERLRLDEFKPRVLSSFVRNRLIDEVYLPIFGDNLAKQLGALGEAKRTDLMGLLLLISPPGYGKTTLMEYLANRLGLVFMKINGPALGHGVRSLDPAEAGHATARQEVEKINLALEMGNNVLLYLDDIQHTHPELLQKFISLCDAQRKIEGVWRGRTRTYDLRGKKFIVCMAGNPYTESGETFQIPDMLANRADVYNLGDILGGKDELFAMSYVENALTSNPVLAQVATNGHKDIHVLVRMARSDDVPATELAHPYSQVELEEILSVLRKLLRCQEVLLAVNATYISSASMDDAYRTEPPFKLQGSYRNMNKLAEKIVPVMNDEELEQLLADHYVGEAQTLTSDAEQNLLKLAELRGKMTPAQQTRWTEIKDAYRRRQLMGGAEDDPVARVTGQLVALSENVKGIGDELRAHAERPVETPDVGARLGEALVPHLEQLHGALAERAQAAPAAASSPVAAAAVDFDGAKVGTAVGEALRPYLDRMDRLLVAISTEDPDEASHEFDPSRLAARQLQVIEAGLLPVLRSMNVNLRISKEVWDRLGRVAASLRKLTGEPEPEEDAPGVDLD